MTTATKAKTLDDLCPLPEITESLFFQLKDPNDNLLLTKMLESRNTSQNYQVELFDLLCFDHFLRTGVAHVMFGDRYVVAPLCIDDYTAIIDLETYCVYTIDERIMHLTDYRIKKAIEYAPAAVLLSKLDINRQESKKLTHYSPSTKKRYFWLLINADLEEYAEESEEPMRCPLHSFVSDFHMEPCVSFTCLSRFYSIDIETEPEELEALLKRFAEGEIKVTEYTESDWKSVSKKDTKKYTEKQITPNRPAPGYTLVTSNKQFTVDSGWCLDLRWHRPPVVLINDSQDPKHSLLFGQDDDAYFGVELPKKASSIDQAFEVLIPAAVKQAYKENRAVNRQGEWFTVARKLEEVIPMTKAVITFRTVDITDNSEVRSVSLNRDHEKASHHYVLTKDGRVASDGTIYACDACLQHENYDHPDLYTKDWVSYHRNTAVRSFSVKGVD
jgi:hypothetical protein